MGYQIVKLFLYGLAISGLILAVAIRFFTNFKQEIFFGWSIPALAGLLTIYFVLRAANIDYKLVTNVLIKGFIIKMIYYALIIFGLFKVYAFEPLPFIGSFAGFFLALHALEAVIINNISK